MSSTDLTSLVITAPAATVQLPSRLSSNSLSSYNNYQSRYGNHVPVEDDQHRLVGLVTHRTLLAHLARNMNSGNGREQVSIPVRDIMKPEPITVTPETTTLDAIAIMREHQVSCLPVTKDGKLVGLITEHDFLPIARQLLEDQLRGRPEVEITNDARRISGKRDSESTPASP